MMSDICKKIVKNKRKYLDNIEKIIFEVNSIDSDFFKHTYLVNNKESVIDYLEFNQLDIESIRQSESGLLFNIYPNVFIFPFDSDEYKIMLNKYYSAIIELEKIILDKQISNRNSYSFQPFIEKIINQSQLENFKTKHFIFNVGNWCDFLKNTLKHFYPDFTFENLKKKSWVKFVKIINEEWQIWFEYDENEFKYYLRKGEISLPNIEIFIYNILSDEKIKLGQFKDPFIGDFIVSPEVFLAHKRIHKVSESHFSFTNYLKVEKIDNTMFKLRNDEYIGEELVDYFYFYFYFNSLFINNYFNYLNYILSSR